MESSPDRDVLDSYIDRVLALKKKHDDAIDEQDLQDIAKEIGLSDEDLARVGEAAYEYMTRGHGFLRHALWDDALNEFRNAHTLVPKNAGALFGLARAYLGRWEAQGKKDDRIQAEAFARRCLEIEPNHEGCFEIIDKAEHPEAARQAATGSGKSAGAKRSLGAIVAAGVAVLLLLGMIVSLVSSKPSQPRAASRAVAPIVAFGKISTGTESSSVKDIPTSLVDPSHDLELVTQRSRLSYGSYKFSGALKLVGRHEFSHLRLKITGLDANGHEVGSQERDALASGIIARPGDSLLFATIARFASEPAAVQLSPVVADRLPAPPQYDPATILNLSWLHRQPTQFSIVARQRQAMFNAYGNDKYGFLRVASELENVGQGAVRHLDLSLRTYDKAEQLRSSTTLHPLPFGDGVAWLPGERLPIFSIQRTSKSYDHYRFVVTNIE